MLVKMLATLKQVLRPHGLKSYSKGKIHNSKSNRMSHITVCKCMKGQRPGKIICYYLFCHINAKHHNAFDYNFKRYIKTEQHMFAKWNENDT